MGEFFFLSFKTSSDCIKPLNCSKVPSVLLKINIAYISFSIIHSFLFCLSLIIRESVSPSFSQLSFADFLKISLFSNHDIFMIGHIIVTFRQIHLNKVRMLVTGFAHFSETPIITGKGDNKVCEQHNWQHPTN